MKARLAVGVVALLAGARLGAQAAEPDTYLFDVLRHPNYKSALRQILKGPVPAWVRTFMERGDGVVSPMRVVDIAGHAYRLDHLCKPHDCAGHVLSVLWSAGGRTVSAVLVEGSGAPVIYGDPSPEQTRILTAAARDG